MEGMKVQVTISWKDGRSALVGRCGSAQASSHEACRVWRLTQSEFVVGSCRVCEGKNSPDAEYDKSRTKSKGTVAHLDSWRHTKGPSSCLIPYGSSPCCRKYT